MTPPPPPLPRDAWLEGRSGKQVSHLGFYLSLVGRLAYFYVNM